MICTSILILPSQTIVKENYEDAYEIPDGLESVAPIGVGRVVACLFGRQWRGYLYWQYHLYGVNWLTDPGTGKLFPSTCLIDLNILPVLWLARLRLH